MMNEQHIENLKKLKSFHNGSYGADIDKAIKALEQTRWIPVSEKLPEENGGYLVTVKRGYVTTALWVGTAEFWNEVTAWMPLPKPYDPQERRGKE